VRSLDGETIGKGEPGPVTHRLGAAFHTLVHSTGTPIDG
jgi:hypothetical protein